MGGLNTQERVVSTSEAVKEDRHIMLMLRELTQEEQRENEVRKKKLRQQKEEKERQEERERHLAVLRQAEEERHKFQKRQKEKEEQEIKQKEETEKKEEEENRRKSKMRQGDAQVMHAENPHKEEGRQFSHQKSRGEKQKFKQEGMLEVVEVELEEQKAVEEKARHDLVVPQQQVVEELKVEESQDVIQQPSKDSEDGNHICPSPKLLYVL